MKRLVLALLSCSLLLGCDAKTEETTDGYKLPDELIAAGCKIYKMQGKSGYTDLRTIYCPNAQTTTIQRNGEKTTSTSIITG